MAIMTQQISFSVMSLVLTSQKENEVVFCGLLCSLEITSFFFVKIRKDISKTFLALSFYQYQRFDSIQSPTDKN